MFKEFLFPKFCVGCGKFGKYICLNCREQLLFIDRQTCIYCHRSSYRGLTHPLCRRKNGVDGAISIFKYNNLLRKIVKTIKYRLASDILKELVFLAENEIKINLDFYQALKSALFWQAIPLHSQRYKERGFNQAELIIDQLGSIIKAPRCDFIIRVKYTLPQAQIISRKERFENTQGAFQVKFGHENSIVGKSILLVDDVVTSGSTVKEATRILKLKKATKVYIFSLAKG